MEEFKHLKKERIEILSNAYVTKHTERNKIKSGFWGLWVMAALFLGRHFGDFSDLMVLDSTAILLIMFFSYVLYSLNNFRIQSMKENNQIYSALQKLLEKRCGSFLFMKNIKSI